MQQVLSSQNPEPARWMPKEWAEGVRGALWAGPESGTWPMATQVCLLAKTPKIGARRDLTKLIPNYLHICSFWQEPVKPISFKIQWWTLPFTSSPSLPSPAGWSTSVLLYPWSQKPFFLNFCLHSWPFPAWEKPFEFSPLHHRHREELVIFLFTTLYLRKFPLFFPLLDRFNQLQVHSSPAVQKTVENGLKIIEKNHF